MPCLIKLLSHRTRQANQNTSHPSDLSSFSIRLSREKSTDTLIFFLSVMLLKVEGFDVGLFDLMQKRVHHILQSEDPPLMPVQSLCADVAPLRKAAG